MIHAELALKVVLRVTGTVLCLAIVAVFMPGWWMARAHAWLALGPWPEQPIADYLARTLSGMYAMVGGLLWVIAGDVRRYDGLLHYLALAWLGLAMAVLFIGLGLADPLRAYVVLDSSSALVACSLMLLLRRHIPRRAESERENP